jgi:hypothetical protein
MPLKTLNFRRLTKIILRTMALLTAKYVSEQLNNSSRAVAESRGVQLLTLTCGKPYLWIFHNAGVGRIKIST